MNHSLQVQVSIQTISPMSLDIIIIMHFVQIALLKTPKDAYRQYTYKNRPDQNQNIAKTTHIEIKGLQ